PPHYPRIRPWHFDPFWTLGIGPVWIHEIRRPRRVSPRLEVRSLDREEVIYEGANLTYVVVFPELRRTVRELRLIVPAVELLSDEGTVEALDFELIFDQWVEVPR
ncbi:MAG: hypothetical protein OEO23_06905, partial [Gemmatimonadota bacterium]|nr:hypothetical protein [Gemmatimonadota bacterium]